VVDNSEPCSHFIFFSLLLSYPNTTMIFTVRISAALVLLTVVPVHSFYSNGIPSVKKSSLRLPYSSVSAPEAVYSAPDGELRKLIDTANEGNDDDDRSHKRRIKLQKQQQELQQQLQVRRRRTQRLARQHSRVVASTLTPPGTTITSNLPTRRSSPGLTRPEEIQYSFQIRTFRAAVRLRDQIIVIQDKMKIHPTESEWAAACGTSVGDLRRVLLQGQQAREALVSANTGLVTNIAKRHYYALKTATEAGGGVGTILTLADMIQEGNLGLMEAAERYEPEKGFRFSTYATWWVRQRILRSISDSSRTIRLPAHVHSTLQKINKMKTEVKREMGREPSLPELASHLEMTEEKLQMYTDSSRNVVSLELPLRSGGSLKDDRRTIGDTLASDAPTPEEDAEADYLRRDILATMDNALTEMENQVIVQRFGLEDGKPRTVSETAERLAISRDRVRLVEARALNKLRHPQRNYRLKEYVGGDGSDGSAQDPDREEVHTNRLWFF
jgi:RNA polymerase primary sigma factor